jgi:hypothetical protein
MLQAGRGIYQPSAPLVYSRRPLREMSEATSVYEGGACALI